MRSFVQLADTVGATTKKLEKLRLISEFFRNLSVTDTALAARFLSARSFAGYDERTLGVGGRLSITHKFSSKSEAQLDVGQAGQASPNDRVSGSRIIGTREIAPESRDPDQVSRN